MVRCRHHLFNRCTEEPRLQLDQPMFKLLLAPEAKQEILDGSVESRLRQVQVLQVIDQILERVQKGEGPPMAPLEYAL